MRFSSGVILSAVLPVSSVLFCLQPSSLHTIFMQCVWMPSVVAWFKAPSSFLSMLYLLSTLRKCILSRCCSCCGVIWPIEVPRDVYAQEFKHFHGLRHFTVDERRGEVCVWFPPEVQNHLFHLFVAFSARLCSKYHPESLCTSSLYPVSSLPGMSQSVVVLSVNLVMLLDEWTSLQSCVYWQQRTGLST